ncbi:MAG TPA: hypothetical protein VIL16_11335 [Trebonia sp.]
MKYIANSAAKNMSSLDNQMMVPTLTKFGLLAGLRGTGAVSVTDVVATIAIITTPRRGCAADPPTLVQVPWKIVRRARFPQVRCWPPRAPASALGPLGCWSMKVVVYSHDADTRAEMKLAIGARPAPDVPEAEIVEVATAPALFRLLDAGGIDVMVLDGEAQPAGGMGVSRQAKDEIYNCPPALLVIGRADDRWLATWSRAEAVISHPIDPVALAKEVAALMRSRAGSLPSAK